MSSVSQSPKADLKASSANLMGALKGAEAVARRIEAAVKDLERERAQSLQSIKSSRIDAVGEIKRQRTDTISAMLRSPDSSCSTT